LCGQGRVVRLEGRAAGIVSDMVGWWESGETIEDGGFESKEVFVGAELITCFIRSGTEEGVTLSIIVKAGRRRTVVESSTAGSEGRGMFEAESISFCFYLSHVYYKDEKRMWKYPIFV
jgi:hypothetical protein